MIYELDGIAPQIAPDAWVAPDANLIVPLAFGYLATTLIALPLAPHLPMTAQQIGLLALSGGVILAGGGALLMLGPRYLPAASTPASTTEYCPTGYS